MKNTEIFKSDRKITWEEMQNLEYIDGLYDKLGEMIRSVLPEDSDEYHKVFDKCPDVTPPPFRIIYNEAIRMEKIRRIKRLKVAAVFAALTTATILTTTYIANSPVVAEIQRRLEVVFLQEKQEVDITNIYILKNVIENWEDVPDIKKLYTDMRIPTYVPEGYEFKKLTMLENNEGQSAIFEFQNAHGDMYVTVQVGYIDPVITSDNLSEEEIEKIEAGFQ